MHMKVLGLAILLAASGALHASEPQQAIYGDWMILRELVAAEDSHLSSDEIESLIGASAHYDADEVVFAGQRCERPVYDSYRETERTLLQSRTLRPEDLRLQNDTSLAIEIGCADGNDEFDAGSWLLVAGPDRLITEVDGVYFELKRLVTSDNTVAQP
jgi:hypothetical protein